MCGETTRPVREEQLRFESGLANISCRFINLQLDEMDRETDRVLGEITALMQADRSFIFELDESGTKHQVTHLWGHTSGPDDPVVVGVAVQEGFPWVGAKMLRREEIIVNDIEALPSDADREKRYCRSCGIQSFLMVPMYSGDLNVGLIGIDCIQQQRDWSERDIRQFRLLGEVLANALIRKRKDRDSLATSS